MEREGSDNWKIQQTASEIILKVIRITLPKTAGRLEKTLNRGMI